MACFFLPIIDPEFICSRYEDKYWSSSCNEDFFLIWITPFSLPKYNKQILIPNNLTMLVQRITKLKSLQAFGVRKNSRFFQMAYIDDYKITA